MRKVFWVILIVAGIIFFPNTPSRAQNYNDYYFESFEAHYYLDKNDKDVATMRVVETLDAVFPEYDQNHGIERAIPLKYESQSIAPEILSITDVGGANFNYSTYSSNGYLVLRIGDADSYVHGKVSYVIEYNLKNVIKFYEDHDELYWNVNGTEWYQAFNTVKGTLHISSELIEDYQYKEVCFTGSFGDSSNDCTIQRIPRDGTVEVEFTAQDLFAGENLSFAVAFNPNTFTEDKWPAQLLKINLATMSALPMLASFFAISRWRKYGRDPEGRGVIPQYTPPENLNAIASKTLLEEDFKANFIAAGIIELAVNGYIKIHEEKKGKILKRNEYELELINSDGSKLDAEQKALIDAMFDGGVGDKYNLSTNRYKLADTAQKLNSSLPKRLTEEGYFNENPAKTIGKNVAWGALIFGVGFASIITLALYWGPAVGLMLSGVIFMILAKFMPVKTAKGVEAKEYILGLKDYIELAEKDRIEFLQSPEGVRQYGDPTSKKAKLNLFEKLLPFAMIFGLEKQWAKQFQDLYTNPPEWFSGGTHAFIASDFANSIGRISSTSANTFSAPSSSGGSGLSGGGGFSGGGGGGGGGGGW